MGRGEGCILRQTEEPEDNQGRLWVSRCSQGPGQGRGGVLLGQPRRGNTFV